MDYKKLETLITKYFEGETSLQEEAQLKNYFQQSDVDPELKQYQPLFQFYKKEERLELSSDFENRLLQQLQQHTHTPHIARRRTLYNNIARIAAAVILAIGVFWGIQQYSKSSTKTLAPVATTTQEEMTPEEAYKEVMSALALVSSKLNKGKHKAMEGLGEINKAAKTFTN